MKQCEPLKELLNAPKECAPCPSGLGNHRCMPMGHVGIIASEPVTGASDLVAVDVMTQELPKVFILRDIVEMGCIVNLGCSQHTIMDCFRKGKKKAKRRQQKQARHRNK